MATITQQNIGSQHEKISIQLTRNDYMPAVEKALKKLSRDANIPGFRKGMVPVGHIKKMYGQSVFTDEVLKVAGTKLEEHLLEHKAEIFARPIPAGTQAQYDFNIDAPEDYLFEFEIGTRPRFEIPLLKGSETLPLLKVNVTDDMLNEEIEKLQLKAGEMKDSEEVKHDDDVLNVVFEEADENGETLDGGIIKDNSLLLRYFSGGLKEQLMGKKKGDTIVFSIRGSFDEKVQESILADLGITASAESNEDKKFRLTIEKIAHIEKSEPGKEMFEKIYPGREIDTLEKFKEVLKGEVQQYWDNQSRSLLHNDIFERLVHETPITLPAEFLKRWMSVGGEKYTPMEVVEKEFGKFEHQLRWQLVSDKIIEENKLEVTTQEMEQAARMQVMSYFGQYGNMPDMDAAWMEPVIKKQLADKKFADELYNKIITDKLFFTIENQLNLQETPVSKEDFLAKINQPHHHHH